jgi:hypothetical protein
LAAALRAHADGLYHLQAAVGLLIGHQRWLYRDDFVAQFIRVVPGSSGGLAAFVGWRAAVRALAGGRLACSASEGCVLRIAASIAEGVALDLRECLSTLDAANAGLVVRAVLAAGGHHEAATGLSGVASW